MSGRILEYWQGVAIQAIWFKNFGSFFILNADMRKKGLGLKGLKASFSLLLKSVDVRTLD